LRFGQKGKGNVSCAVIFAWPSVKNVAVAFWLNGGPTRRRGKGQGQW